MSAVRARARLQSEIGSLEAMLQGRGDALDALERAALEDRAEEILEQLRALEEKSDRSARVVIYYAGGPVTGSTGIDASFATTSVGEFQDLIVGVHASKLRQGRALGARGSLPNVPEARFNIVATPRGSFGFELEEAGQIDLLKSPLAESVDEALALVEASTHAQEEFLDAITETDPRVLKVLKNFVKTLKGADAVVKLETPDKSIHLARDDVQNAWTNTKSVDVQEDEEFFDGVFKGATLETRRFDFALVPDEELLSGKVAASVDEATLADWITSWTGRICRARVAVKQTTTPVRTSTTYVLLGLEDQES